MITPDHNVIRKRWWIRRKAERRLARLIVVPSGSDIASMVNDWPVGTLCTRVHRHGPSHHGLTRKLLDRGLLSRRGPERRGWLNLMILCCSARLFSAMTPPSTKARYSTKSLNDSLLSVPVLFWSELLSGEVVGGVLLS